MMLGGLFGPVIALSLPISAIGAIATIHRFPVNLARPLTITVGFLIAWCIFWLGINYAGNSSDPAHAELAATIALWLGMLALSFLIPIYSTGFQKLQVGSLLLMGFLAVTFIDETTLMTVTVNEDGAASYQGVARSLMIVGFLVISCTSDTMRRIFIAAFTITALFVIGSRSELYGFIAAYALLEGVLSRNSRFSQFTLVVLVAVTFWLALQNMNFLAASRQFEVFNLEQSSSWAAREYMLVYAQQQVVENPFFGVYGGHWNLGEGEYAHNALSAWVSLGFPGFALLIAACGCALIVSIRGLIKLPYSRWAKFATLVNVSNLLLLAVAKPVFWEMPAFGWGLALIVAQEWRSVNVYKQRNLETSCQSQLRTGD